MNIMTKGGGRGDLEQAWTTFKKTVCELEEQVLAHRESIGIADHQVSNTAATLWGGSTMQSGVWIGNPGKPR